MADVETALTDIEPGELAEDSSPDDDEARKQKRREYDRERRRRKLAGEPTKKRRSPGRPRKATFTSQIEFLLHSLAVIWTMRDEECGPMLDQQAHDIAVALNDWAMRDPRVYRMLENMVKGGGGGALAFALWPLAMQLTEHHIKPAIERRQQAIAEAQEAWEEQGHYDTTPGEQVADLRDIVEREVEQEAFVPPNVIPPGR